MTQTRRRLILYGAALVLGAGLLAAGFGITVPPDPSVRLSGAELLGGLGDYERALEICDTVLEEHPDCVDAMVYRATFLARAERHDEALAAYDEALGCADIAPEMRRHVLADRASVLLESGRTSEFERARAELARGGLDAHVHMLDGLTATKGGDWNGAAQAYARALAADPENAQARSLLGRAHLEGGRLALTARRFEDARTAFDAARALYPGSAVALREAAEVRLALDDPKDALAVLREAPMNTPGLAALCFRTGTRLLEQGDWEGALESLEAAVAADAEHARTLFEKEPAWDAHRLDPAIEAVLFETPKRVQVGLTGKD
jgi:tetratricopeptide (TPR) repeat protein